MWGLLSVRQQAAVIRWAIFSAALGAMPLLLAFVVHFVVDAPVNPVRQGDLYLIAATLAFVGVGTIVAKDGQDERRVLLAAGGAFIVGLLAALLYAFVAASPRHHSLAVDISSVVLYLLCAVTSLGCVILAEG